MKVKYILNNLINDLVIPVLTICIYIVLTSVTTSFNNSFNIITCIFIIIVFMIIDLIINIIKLSKTSNNNDEYSPSIILYLLNNRFKYKNSIEQDLFYLKEKKYIEIDNNIINCTSVLKEYKSNEDHLKYITDYIGNSIINTEDLVTNKKIYNKYKELVFNDLKTNGLIKKKGFNINIIFFVVTFILFFYFCYKTTNITLINNSILEIFITITPLVLLVYTINIIIKLVLYITNRKSDKEYCLTEKGLSKVINKLNKN